MRLLGRKVCVAQVACATAVVCLLMGLCAHAAEVTAVHRYDFESDDGSDSIDGVDGVLVGEPTFSNDAMSGNQAMFLNGAGSWVDFPEPMEFTENFSIAVWVWPNSAATWPDYNLMGVVGNARSGWGIDGFKMYFNEWMPNDDPGPNNHLIAVESGMGTGGDGAAVAESTDVFLNMDEWNHVVMTVDVNSTVDGKVSVYMNGDIGIDAGPIQAEMNTNQPWAIGAMGEGNSPWMGGIDDLQIYTGILSEEQAQWLFEHPGEAIGVPIDPILLGDVNLDGDVNGLDVDPFVGLVTSGGFQKEADMNGDGSVNGLDVDPFVAAVVGGGIQTVPEPSTCMLALMVLVSLGLCRRQRK